MDSYKLTIHYNTSINAHSLAAYHVSIEPTDAGLTGRLSQHGPVVNNVLTTCGTFSSIGHATRALLDYINTFAFVVEYRDRLGARVRLQHRSQPSGALDQFTHIRVLGSRTVRGEFIAD